MNQSKPWTTALALIALAASYACDRSDSPPTNRAQGEAKKGDTKVLETGAEVLQGFDPVKQIDTCLEGFHTMKDHPELVMEAHHILPSKERRAHASA